MRWLLVIISAVTLNACVSSLSGRVIDHQGQPIFSGDARINVSSMSKDPWSKVVSVSKGGYFEVEGIEDQNEYLIEALVPGFQISSLTIRGNSSHPIVFKLNPITTSSVDAIGTNQSPNAGRGSGGAAITPPSL